ncbi:HAD family hydrolase [Pectinatus haikarae]|uniref:HAD family hydrolase n=1 Tax=Pectinatus haikarae TaxID=349096 RepID=UPI0018C46734|nr:hypothetical protein [Pectinatus haikarae]
MISLNLFNDEVYNLNNIVFDFNGVLAENGRIAPEVKKLLKQLVSTISISVITADTFGTAQEELSDIEGVRLIILPAESNGNEKAHYVQKWGAETTAVVGNGANDQPMFSIARLKVCVIGHEGASSGIVAAANIVVTSPEDAIRLFMNVKRLQATLRS